MNRENPEIKRATAEDFPEFEVALYNETGYPTVVTVKALTKETAPAAAEEKYPELYKKAASVRCLGQVEK